MSKDDHMASRSRVRVETHAVYLRAWPHSRFIGFIITQNCFICPFPKREIPPYTPSLTVSLCLSSSLDDLSSTDLFLPVLPIDPSQDLETWWPFPAGIYLWILLFLFSACWAMVCSFSQQTFTEHLLCSRPNIRHRQYQNKLNRATVLKEVSSSQGDKNRKMP